MPGCLGIAVAPDDEFGIPFMHEIRIFGDVDSYKAHRGEGDQKVKDIYDHWNAAFEGVPDGHTLAPDELKEELVRDDFSSVVYTWGEALGHMYLEGK